MIKRFFPFLKWYEGYNYLSFRYDLIAGITVALVLIPQSMAYAQLAGLPAYYGLYAAFLPPMVAALFGSSYQLATGPVAIVSLITAASLEPLATAGSEQFIAYAILLALMVGIFQFLLGALRLGIVVNLLAHPVIIGFTNAGAIIIATSQLSKIFGVYVDGAEHHYETVYRVIVSALNYTHFPTLGMALLAFAIMIGLKSINPKIPNVLVAAVVAIIIAAFFGFENKYSTELSRIKSNEVKETIIKYNNTLNEKNFIANVGSLKQLDEIFKTELTESLGSICVRCHTKQEFATLGIDISEKSSVDRVEILKVIHNAKIHSKYLEILNKREPAYRSKLREYKLEAVELENGEKEFYLPGEVPANLKGDGKDWRIIVKNGMLEKKSIKLTSGGDVVGSIPAGLPKIEFPAINFSVISQLISAMIIISLIGFMEAISIAKAMAARTGQRIDPNQELIGQGMANIIGSFGQSYPTSGSFSRSAVNLQSGGITGFSNVLSSLFVALTLLFFTPALYFLPQAVLAAIIMIAVIGLINIKSFVHAYKTQKYDGVIAIVTFIGTLVFAPHLDRGIIIGLLLTLGHFIYRRIEPKVVILSKHWDDTYRNAERFKLTQCRYISMIRFQGSLTFASCNFLEDKILEQTSIKPDLKLVLIVGNAINEIDSSGVGMLESLVSRLQEAKYQIFFTGLQDTIVDIFKQTGLFNKIGEDHFFSNAKSAVEKIHAEAHQYSEEQECPLIKSIVLK